MEAIILAGGFGTRLQTVVNDVPKPMAPIQKKPFLEYVFYYLKKYGITKITLSVSYKREIIQEYFGDRFCGIEVNYSIEEEPLGTGGAIQQSLKLCQNDTVYVINGDTFFDVDLNALLEVHKTKCADLTLTLKPMEDFDRYGIVQCDAQYRIEGFLEKEYRSQGDINGGVYIINRHIFQNNTEDKFSFETFMSEHLKTLNMYAMISQGYFIDIGIPEDYFRAEQELCNVI